MPPTLPTTATLDESNAGEAKAAFKTAIRVGGMGDAVAAALPDQSKAVRLAAYGALRRDRDEALADRLLPVVKERYGIQEAERLLSACSSAVVAAELPTFAAHTATWSTYAKHHIQVFTAYATAALADRTPEQWTDWWSHHRTGLSAALENAPEAWLTLLVRHPAASVDSAAVFKALPALLTADRDGTWAYLLDPHRERMLASLFQRNAHLRRIAAEPAERIATLTARAGENANVPGVLRYVAPSRRIEVLDAIRSAGVHLDERSLLEILPHRARIESARRLLEERRTAGNAVRREATRAHMPYEEVRDHFSAATRRSDVEERARAYGNLVTAAAFRNSPDALTDLFGRLKRAAGDQGLVHEAILRALTKVRPQDWTSAHLGELAYLTESWLTALPRSSTTVSLIVGLAARMVNTGLSVDRPDLVVYGENEFDRLLTETTRWQLTAALRALPHRFTVELARRAAPVLAAKAEIGEYHLLWTLAGALGRRLAEAPELVALLHRVSESKNLSHAREAVRLLAGIPQGRHDRLAELATARPGLPELFPALALHRGDLVEAWLAAERDTVPGVLFQPWNPTVLGRWPQAALDAYREALRVIATDDRRTDAHRGQAVRALSRIPGIPLEALLPLLHSDNSHVKAIALADLHHANPTQAVWEVLPEYLDSKDAPTAAAVMDRLAHVSKPVVIAAQAPRLLDSPKVTVHKQVVRVLSRYRVAGAAEILTGLWAEADLHPSVREAVAATAADRLAEPWAQAIVAAVDEHTPDVQAAALGLAPERVPADFRARYTELLTAAASDDDARLQVTGSQGLARWARYEARAADALVDLATDLDTTDVWAAAMNALCANVTAGGDPGPLLRAVDALRAVTDEPNAEKDRDLPVRQRFERIVSLLSPLYGGPTPAATTVEALTERLPTHLGTKLLAGTIDWDAGTESAVALTSRAQDPVEARLIGEALDERMNYGSHTFTLGFLTSLVGSGDLHAAIVAAGIIESAAVADDWEAPWREVLRRLRAHPSSMVQVLAFGVYTSEEYEGGNR
ncbi:hypothetical protein L0U85_08070 [Glycomyces sp. L485]|uniref:hypothetical protein n=1 Tax=Glycomyces sp. L485 TaxID=2909235 RepID=UPI001F4AF67E|nr:hypothetical protein [Glycomyces sp. L485]MCH7230804.1 hypothetical protein [Glycomyces sp. L485]